MFFKKELEMFAPVKGELKTIDQTPDEAFAKKMMGDGVVIFPSEGKIYAPFDGRVRFVFPTKQAIGLEAKNKVEVLIHVGIDTGLLNGEGFTLHVEDNQSFQQGDLLLEFDLEYLKTKVDSLATPIIFTNLNGGTFEIVKDSLVSNQDIIVKIK